MKQPSWVILAHDKKNLKHPNKHFLYSPKTEISKTKTYIKLDNHDKKYKRLCLYLSSGLFSSSYDKK